MPKKLGVTGDAIVGSVVMNVFFLCCMAYFDRNLLLRFKTGALPMLGFATFIGVIAGVSLGRDIRRSNLGIDHGRRA